jgi:hypothetical protein
MAIAWYLCPYKRDLSARHPSRYCAMDDFTAAIRANGGEWAETEVLGDHAIVKVRANVATLTTIAEAAGFTRLPVDRLDDPLSSLSVVQKTAIRNKVIALGYTAAEVTARFGDDLGVYTLGELLRFVASRRLRPRYDIDTDTIICDGPIQPVRSVDSVDEAVV